MVIHMHIAHLVRYVMLLLQINYFFGLDTKFRCLSDWVQKNTNKHLQ